ncbi:MAG: hypothetical protein JSR61_02720 [Proteobacteria bacterium]|nr:hypothetical protein [Pseudomonadota bacterium]
MQRRVAIKGFLTCVAVLAVMAGAVEADEVQPPKKKAPITNERPKFKLDLSGEPQASNSPAPPPGTATLRRDSEGGLPFLGLKLSTPLGN